MTHSRTSGTACARARFRRGFTLFEILLVLAIISAAVALAWPSIIWMQRRARLEQGAEQVRTKISTARVHAVESGVVYQFRFEPGGRRFIVLPFDHDSLAAAAQINSQVKIFKMAGMLAQGVRFEGGQTMLDSGTGIPGDWLSGLPDPSEYTGASWSGPLLFYPDGTSASAEFFILDEQQKRMVVSVRGLTGTATVSIPAGG